jgi:hypothetical protein
MVNVTCSTIYRFLNFSLRPPKSSQKPNITGLLPALLSARATQCSRLLNFSLRQPGSSLTLRLADDEAGVSLLDGPGRREAARGRHGRCASGSRQRQRGGRASAEKTHLHEIASATSIVRQVSQRASRELVYHYCPAAEFPLLILRRIHLALTFKPLRGFFLTQRSGASPAPPRTTAKKRVGVTGPELLWQKPWESWLGWGEL